jgi:hypothetical protein
MDGETFLADPHARSPVGIILLDVAGWAGILHLPVDAGFKPTDPAGNRSTKRLTIFNLAGYPQPYG